MQSGLALLLIGVYMTVLSEGQQTTTTVEHNQSPPTTKRVFLNVRGDAKAAHRMWSYLDFELEDRDFQIVDAEQDADAIVDVELKRQPATANLTTGVIHLSSHTQGKDTYQELCASQSTAGSHDMFQGSGETVFRELQEQFPNVRTLKIDDASNLAASKSLRFELEQAAKAAGLNLTADMTADIVLRIDLTLAEVPIDEQTVQYQVSAATRDRRLFSESGTAVLSAKVKGEALKVCPDRFNDLDWILGYGDPLVNVALSIAKNLNKRTRKPAAPPVSNDHH